MAVVKQTNLPFVVEFFQRRLEPIKILPPIEIGVRQDAMALGLSANHTTEV